MTPFRYRQAFTIVELLIVIVIIAILAAITIVSYNGIQQRAKITARTAEMDRIGKAIRLWSAEKGSSMGTSGAGAGGQGFGDFTGKNYGSYTATSMEDELRASGYLKGPLEYKGYLIALCTSTTDDQRVVLSEISPAPSKTAREQIPTTVCPHSTVDSYSASPYSKNLVKVY